MARGSSSNSLPSNISTGDISVSIEAATAANGQVERIAQATDFTIAAGALRVEVESRAGEFDSAFVAATVAGVSLPPGEQIDPIVAMHDSATNTFYRTPEIIVVTNGAYVTATIFK